MLNVTASQQVLLDEAVTKPIYLIDIEFPTPQSLSTNGDQTVGANTYLGGEIGLSAAADWATASVRMPPSVARMQTLIAGDWRGKSAQVYLLPAVNYPQRIAAGYVKAGYGRQGFVVDDPILLIDGILTGASADASALTVEITHRGRVGKWAPRIRLMPPICNWLPAAGTRLSWAGEIFVLEAR